MHQEYDRSMIDEDHDPYGAIVNRQSLGLHAPPPARNHPAAACPGFKPSATWSSAIIGLESTRVRIAWCGPLTFAPAMSRP